MWEILILNLYPQNLNTNMYSPH